MATIKLLFLLVCLFFAYVSLCKFERVAYLKEKQTNKNKTVRAACAVYVGLALTDKEPGKP